MEWYLGLVIGFFGTATHSILIMGTFVGLVIFWALASDESKKISKHNRIIAWSFLTFAIWGLITSSIMDNYIDKHLDTEYSCEISNIYENITFTNSVMIFRTSLVDNKAGYGIQDQNISITPFKQGMTCENEILRATIKDL